MGLFKANNTVANFRMVFVTLSAYDVVASEVDREALAHVACEQISFESAILAPTLVYQQKFSAIAEIDAAQRQDGSC